MRMIDENETSRLQGYCSCFAEQLFFFLDFSNFFSIYTYIGWGQTSRFLTSTCADVSFFILYCRLFQSLRQPVTQKTNGFLIKRQNSKPFAGLFLFNFEQQKKIPRRTLLQCSFLSRSVSHPVF